MEYEDTNEFDSRRLRIVVVIILLVLLLAVLLFFLFRPKAAKQSVSADEGTVVSETSGGIVWDNNAEEGEIVQQSAEEVQEELNRKVEEGMINISMNTSPVFPDGQTEGNLLIYNSEQNNYPQVVYIQRKDTGEEIYRSGAIPVGSKVERAKLAVPLEAGSYECVAYFNNVDAETGMVLGTAGAEIVVIVQN